MDNKFIRIGSAMVNWEDLVSVNVDRMNDEMWYVDIETKKGSLEVVASKKNMKQVFTLLESIKNEDIQQDKTV